MATMAANAAHFSLSTFLHSSPSPQISFSFLRRPRFSCRASLSQPQHGVGTGFMDFPYISSPHKQLMVDLVSTVGNRSIPYLILSISRRMYSRIRMKPEQLRLLFISDPASNPLRLITYLELGFTVNYHQEKR